MTLTEKELAKMKHALGMDNKGDKDYVYDAYRRCSYYNEPDEIWECLVAGGYAKRGLHNPYCYIVTELGMQAVADDTGLLIRFTLEFEPKRQEK